MTEKDIKIGDYFTVNGEVVKVQDTGPFLCGIWGSQENFHVVENEKLKPIPLTKEILEKNEWKYSEPFNDWEVLNDDRCPRLYEGGKGWLVRPKGGNYDLCAIAYVHELQHLLWVLGEDSDLKIV